MSKDKSVAQMQREILTELEELFISYKGGTYYAVYFADKHFGGRRDYWEAETFEGLIEEIYNEVVLECKN